MDIEVKIQKDIVLGGYDYGCNLQVVVAPDRKSARLAATADMIETDQLSVEVYGKSGHIAILSQDEIDELRDDVKLMIEAGGTDAELADNLRGVLEEVDLTQQSYANWLFENEYETYRELYAPQEDEDAPGP